MATYKILGQQAPGTGEGTTPTATTQLCVGAAGGSIVSTLVVSSRGTAGTFSIRVAPSADGSTPANKHYLAYVVPIDANSFVTLTLGLTLANGDTIFVGSSNGAIAFSAFGQEN